MIDRNPVPKKSSFHYEDEVNLVLTDGGMGDLVCELVAVDYNIRMHRKIRFHVWVPDYLLTFAQHVLTPGAIVNPFSKAKNGFRHDINGLTTEWNTAHTCMRTHPVDYGFHMLADRHIYDAKEKNYLQINPLKIAGDIPKTPYACLAVAASEPVKMMPVETANLLIKYLQGKGVTPVLLGREESDTGFQGMKLQAKSIDLDKSGCIDMLNKTSLLEAAKIISGAKVMIGMDGGLIHLAGCTGAEIVAGYTLVDPIHVAPIRQGSKKYKFHAVEPDIDIPNRYYQTYKSGFQKGDFRKFPGWERVIASMTADKFIKILEKVL